MIECYYFLTTIHSKAHKTKEETEPHWEKKSLCASMLVIHFSMVHLISDSAAVGNAGLYYCVFLNEQDQNSQSAANYHVEVELCFSELQAQLPQKNINPKCHTC